MTLAVSPVGAELLDDLRADPDQVRQSLDNIARANRWFGGLAAVRWGLARVLQDARGEVTLLDVGTGRGDVPMMAQVWGGRRGLAVRAVALERHPAAARLATGPTLPTVLGCGSALPFGTRSVDVVITSQVAHHLSRAACVLLFRECARVARRGLVVADLRRSDLAAAGFWLGGRLLRFDPYTLADGITSIRRGFLARELEALLAEAGIHAVVRSRPGARLVAAWRVGT